MCGCINLNNEFELIRNTFFHLYCYNAWVKDIYSSNKVKHFELLLEQNGFNLSVEGVARELLSKAEKQNLKDEVEQISNDLWSSFIASGTNKNDEKYKNIMKNLDYLKLDANDTETLNKFQGIIKNKLLSEWARCYH